MGNQKGRLGLSTGRNKASIGCGADGTAEGCAVGTEALGGRACQPGSVRSGHQPCWHLDVELLASGTVRPLT